MIKRGNNKKKKGFTLIELIIVLAVMAIIALIAIPNFAAVRDNSKVKADKQSCETIERTVLMLVSDETVKGEGTVTVTFNETTGKIAAATITEGDMVGGSNNNKTGAESEIKKALEEVKAPQAKTCTGTESDIVGTDENPTTYTIVIKGGSVKVVTGSVKK
jgi:prepilin-type N-terminal cleavage/methylation domain-containing protein